MRWLGVRVLLTVLVVSVLGRGVPLASAEVAIKLPLARAAYQTNEQIDLAVVRASSGPLLAGDLVLGVAGDDGSRAQCTFPVAAVPGRDGAARRTEHLHLNGRLLRPGRYAIRVAVDGAAATTPIELFSHLRQSSYKLINWGRAQKEQQLVEGEGNLGFNVFYGDHGFDEDANFIRAGVDFIPCCAMGGGHQMDLRQECDWSDPYVIRGGTRRAVRSAMLNRTRPNVPGIHFYDEPGLTWAKDPQTGEMTAHAVPWQHRSYEAAFGGPAIPYRRVNAAAAEDVARWNQWAHWKLAFMDAAWQDSRFGVSQVRPDLLSLTQTQYGFPAFSDGHYFTVARSLPIVSGHGGYHDWGPGYFNPSLTLEFARARDFARPCWYLPTWYGSTTTDEFRLEQCLSFQTNIQGIIAPPEIDPYEPNARPAAQGVVESNKLMARLGTIFTTLPVTRPPVALHFSLSNLLDKQTRDMKVCYSHATRHGSSIYLTYLAGKLLQQQFLTVLDEDIVDGTLAAQHKAIVLTSIDHLAPEVVAGLEAFAAGGGLVLQTSDCQQKIKGGVDLGYTPPPPDVRDKMRESLQAAAKLAAALKPHLAKAGIAPIFACDQPGICATRQACGDVEYLFAVNATHDPQGGTPLAMKATAATIAMVPDQRPIYDAVLGGPAAGFAQQGDQLAARLRFGPGQMRVFARTARPIAAVRVATPVLRRDYTVEQDPLRADLAAAVVDAQGGLLCGSIPLEIRLIDPLGTVRYRLYRATDRGTLSLSLPLALNDSPGKWQVSVRELLANTEGTAALDYTAVSSCGWLAGATRRAVFFGPDRKNVFRFARTHGTVTIVPGKGDYQAAAERLAKILKPWDVECKVLPLAEAAMSRSLSADEAATWCGLNYAGRGQIKAGDGNQPQYSGFAVRGAVILLGTPEDNPLIRFLAQERFLPYAADKDFPGPGRGYVAWQRDGIGPGQESLALIAYDAEGMAEAVGATYEAVAGLDPLTPLAMPARSEIVAASKAVKLPQASIVWQIALPDRITAIAAQDDGFQVLSHDGSLTPIAADGRPGAARIVEGPAYAEAVKKMKPAQDAALVAKAQKQIGPGRLVKFVAKLADKTLIIYWGGTLEIHDAQGMVLASSGFVQDISAIGVRGSRILVGQADGRLLALESP
ncbi:MAG: hypothetical protein ABSG68_00440 [Thermoguttaceae bacterium]|jgi:hypothetical protein